MARFSTARTTIVHLKALNEVTEKAITDARNSRFRVPHHELLGIAVQETVECTITQSTDVASRLSRDATPAFEYHSCEMRLTILEKPFEPTLGFVFGSDHEHCDVLLTPAHGAYGVGRRHFRLDIDFSNNKLLLTDQSSNGTYVTYIGVTVPEKIKRATVVVGDGDVIAAGLISLQILEPRRSETDQQSYQRNLSDLKREHDLACPPFRLLNVESTQPTAETTKLALLGPRAFASGHFGDVWRAIDRDGVIYAVKVLKTQSKKMQNLVQQEIKIMTRLHHENLIRIVTDRQVEDSTRYLTVQQIRTAITMEFASGGTWTSQHEREPFSMCDTISAASQILNALAYLHGLQHAHRDIKPDNILVASRRPLLVKLSDFGLAREGSLTTFCGTPQYVAPEVVYGTKYTKLVDIWSLGIFILSHSCQGDMPLLYSRTMTRRVSSTGAKRAVERMQLYASQQGRERWECLTYLGRKMVVEIDARLTAAQCLALLDGASKAIQGSDSLASVPPAALQNTVIVQGERHVYDKTTSRSNVFTKSDRDLYEAVYEDLWGSTIPSSVETVRRLNVHNGA